MAEHECATRLLAVARYARCDVAVTYAPEGEEPPEGVNPYACLACGRELWIWPGVEEAA